MQISTPYLFGTTSEVLPMCRQRSSADARDAECDTTRYDQEVRYYVIRSEILASCTRCKSTMVLLIHYGVEHMLYRT